MMCGEKNNICTSQISIKKRKQGLKSISTWTKRRQEKQLLKETVISYSLFSAF